MNRTIQQSRRSVALACITSAGLCIALVAVAYGIARVQGNLPLANDVAMAGGLLLLAGLPGLVLAVALTGKVRGGAAVGFVGGAAVRLPVGGVIALYGLNWGLATTQSFSQVVAAAYLVFLVIEVLCLSPAMKHAAATEAKTPSVSPTPGDEESV